MEAQIKELAKKQMQVGVEQKETVKFDGNDAFESTNDRGMVTRFARSAK